ncbi:BnaA06g18910D [Brassica napus]|uniref:BnaA06g18910D protein n=1 Tax=Brassica napus TaxID=3708 RepID=A0A078HJR8_BRANA|nr:BnaA06g18910D [Brassica napus]
MAEAESKEAISAIETKLVDKVGEAISAIGDAKHVDQVISAVHSVALLLFPVDPTTRIGDKVSSSLVPCAKDERSDWSQTFYRGVAFPTFARVLLLDVASDWLSCFPVSVQKHLYDSFFLDGPVVEVVQVLVPLLHHVDKNSSVDASSVQTNVERLLILCLLENAGVLKMTKEIGYYYQGDSSWNGNLKPLLSRLSQILSSIPDKARLKSPPLLSSHLYFKHITNQLLQILDDRASCNEANSTDIVLSFVGEMFSRICRRGLSDLLLSEVTPHVLAHVRRLLISKKGSVEIQSFQLDPTSHIWSKTMEAVTDPYAVEKMAEQLLHQLYAEHASDVEAFWTIWTLFHRNVKHQASVRSIFVDKFLLWKVFPIRCLRWILQFSVLECPPVTNTLAKGDITQGLFETTQRIASVWSKGEFLQSVPLEQQAYITAALGLCLENMSREELDRTKDVMHNILQGVSCRLENPGDLVRKMASSIAFMFSKVIDPKNLLYLDDSFTGNAIDWESELQTAVGGVRSITSSRENGDGETKTSADSSRRNKEKKDRKSKDIANFVLADPDEMVDLATLNCGTESDKDDDNASVSSDNSSVTSLEPYDLLDDDKDLGKQFTHLVDVVGALRKTNDADGVEKAIYVAEKLVRASPDELTHIAGDLARILVQVRCSDITVEGEEDSAEEKRQRALIALLVTRPFESLETLNSVLYSPNVDVSQRIMILDVMSEAARELANTRTLKPKHQARGPLISNISDPQPWYLPSDASTPWKKVEETASFHLNWANRYERELQPKPGQKMKGKTRRWSLRSGDRDQSSTDWSQNRFPLYAAAFMLPAMKEFDKKRHGVDLLGRDFVVLGKLVHMLGVCMQCASMHPEASALALSLLDMLQRREVCNHPEAYVRRAVLFAGSSVLIALHPSYIVSALAEGNFELARALEWIRTWALQVADSDIDRDCYSMALSCLQLHAEMALQTSRALESAGGKSSSMGPMNISLPSGISKLTSIKLPSSNVLL